MIINKQILDEHEVCGDGYDYCKNVIGDGTDDFVVDFDAAIAQIRNDQSLTTDKRNGYLFYTLQLKNSVRFYQAQSVGVFMEKYHVFNPLKGQYEPAESIEDAKMLQERIKADFLRHHDSIFTIQQEFFIEAENRSLWQPMASQ